MIFSKPTLFRVLSTAFIAVTLAPAASADQRLSQLDAQIKIEYDQTAQKAVLVRKQPDTQAKAVAFNDDGNLAFEVDGGSLSMDMNEHSFSLYYKVEF